MAWRVWKGVVQNTGRMVNQVLPILMDRVIADLASENEERQAAASASLGDLVQKMGDSILQSIVPIFQERLRNGESEVRCGVCLGLKEVMKSAQKKHITAYMVDLMPAVQEALGDKFLHESPYVITIALHDAEIS